MIRSVCLSHLAAGASAGGSAQCLVKAFLLQALAVKILKDDEKYQKFIQLQDESSGWFSRRSAGLGCLSAQLLRGGAITHFKPLNLCCVSVFLFEGETGRAADEANMPVGWFWWTEVSQYFKLYRRKSSVSSEFGFWVTMRFSEHLKGLTSWISCWSRMLFSTTQQNLWIYQLYRSGLWTHAVFFYYAPSVYTQKHKFARDLVCWSGGLVLFDLSSWCTAACLQRIVSREKGPFELDYFCSCRSKKGSDWRL